MKSPRSGILRRYRNRLKSSNYRMDSGSWYTTYMKKDTLLGMAVLAFAFISIAAYALMRPAPARAPGQIDLASFPEGRYVEHAPYYDIDAYFATTTPLRERLGSRADAGAVTLMENFVSDTIAEFKSNGNFANLSAEDITMMGFDQGRKEVLQVLYLIASSPHTLSYVFTIYEDTLGAHGNTLFHTFTFDLTTGKSLALSDLFVPGAPYLEKVSTLSRERLPDVIGEGADPATIERGTTPEEKNFENFLFDNQDLIILFPPYQVAAYAAGPQTLRIPSSLIADILKQNYR